MNTVEVRKIVTLVEEVRHDGGVPLSTPIRKGAIGAVVLNPYAGRHVDDIQPMMALLQPLAEDITRRLVASLGSTGAQIEAYGKAIMVGVAGELEHAALWHQPSGAGVRAALGPHAKSIIPSTVKVAAAGSRIDVPLHHVTAAYVRSHFDAVEFAVQDGPRPDEIVFVVGLSTGGRPHPRVGGLLAKDVKGDDGLR
jgi:hypothetical protein